MKIVVDGNDGTGKTKLVNALKELGFDVADRGIPTKMTDNDSVQPIDGEFYLILDAPVAVCRERLTKANRDLTERYHRTEDLSFYHTRFKSIAQRLGDRCAVIDATGTPDEVLERVLAVLLNRLLLNRMKKSSPNRRIERQGTRQYEVAVYSFYLNAPSESPGNVEHLVDEDTVLLFSASESVSTTRSVIVGKENLRHVRDAMIDICQRRGIV